MGTTTKKQQQQLHETVSDNLRVLWTGDIAGERYRITRNERYHLPDGGAIIVQIQSGDHWWVADGSDIEPGELLAGLMEAGKLKF